MVYAVGRWEAEMILTKFQVRAGDLQEQKVRVIIFDTLKEMRNWHPKHFESANGISNVRAICWTNQCEPIICLANRYLSCKTIIHEATHAALVLIRSADGIVDDEEKLARFIGQIADGINVELLEQGWIIKVEEI
jgi:hypothetical protein